MGNEELFPLVEKEIEKEFPNKTVKFKLKEMRGLTVDKILNESKTLKIGQDQTANVEIDIAVFNEKRIKASVVESHVNTTKFDINKELPNLPRSVYNWLVKEIDKFNKVTEEEEKNLEGD